MPLLDDLSAWLQRNFAGNDQSGAADTLINQASPPAYPDGSSPMSAMAARQVGARPLNPGEKPGSLTPTPVSPAKGALNPQEALNAGL